MLAKYSIEFRIHPQHNERVDTYRSDDPIAVEDFLMNVLAVGARIHAINHEGVALSPKQADQLLRVAAERLASRLLCAALDVDTAEVKHRFGFTA